MSESLVDAISSAVDAVLRDRSVNAVSSIEVHTAISKALAAEVGVRERDQEHLASLLATTFLGMPRGFDPRQTLDRCDKNSLERLEYVMDERGDGSEGAFIFVQLHRAEREGKHVPGKPWRFIRHNRYVGEARFFLKEKMRSGDPLVVAGISAGLPDLDVYVADLVTEVSLNDGLLEFPASVVPGFGVHELQHALRHKGLYLYEENRSVPNTPYSQRYFVIEQR